MRRPAPAAHVRSAVRLAAAALALWAAGAAALAAQGPPPVRQLPPRALEQIALLTADKASWTPAERKLSSQLVHELKRRRGDPLFEALPKLQTRVEVDEDGSLLVDLKAEATPGLLAEIAARGGQVINSHPRFEAVRARLPLDQLEPLAASPEVRSIRTADRAVVWKVNTSEGDAAHGADTARPSFGVDGAGAPIGILSDGVGSLAARQASLDAPTPVTILPGQAGSGDEGTAMIEIAFDLAPGAPLLFATAFGGQPQFAQNILDLHAAGARVIVDDVFYFPEPVFQDGPIAQAINTVVAAGALYFSAAGNAGNLNDGTAGVWEGDFVGVPGTGPLAGRVVHDFGGGVTLNNIDVDPPFVMTLHWSDPVGATGSNDYDLYLINTVEGKVEASSINVQDGDDDPYESIDSVSFDDTGYDLAVVKFSGDARYIHLNTLRGELAIATDGQTAGHSAAEQCIGVAAVDVATASGGAFTGGAANPVETFSSDGPRRIFYEPDGTPITPGDFLATGGRVLAKPDVAAADCVSTSTPGFTTFCGTSAAAPHVAALAALMQEDGNLTRDGILAVFAATALDIEAAGPDRDSGHGIAMAAPALAAVQPTSASCGPAALELGGTPNSGPQTFRACNQITWGSGSYYNVEGRAPTHIFTDGFESGDTASWSNVTP